MPFIKDLGQLDHALAHKRWKWIRLLIHSQKELAHWTVDVMAQIYPLLSKGVG